MEVGLLWHCSKLRILFEELIYDFQGPFSSRSEVLFYEFPLENQYLESNCKSTNQRVIRACLSVLQIKYDQDIEVN